VITGTVDLDGVTIGYRENGAVEDHPVVLLHALGSDASTWDRFAAVLATAGRQAIALDLRGHGTSSRADEYSLQLMVDDVVRFLDHRRLARIDLVGHSMGGAVATLLAGQHPDRVRRLVVEDAPPPSHETPADDAWPEPPERPPEPVAFDWAVVRPIVRQVRTPDPLWWSRLASVTGPSLLLKGGAASHISQERIDRMAEALPDARVVLIDVGHRIHSQHPDAFADAVLPFLR
jgi:3-oxoadipate enol-lactonase